MTPRRLSTALLADHLADQSPPTRRLVLALRRMILKAASNAAEGRRFGSLCYFHDNVPFGSIGGNICMIEMRHGRVLLSFIQGASVDDPHGLLRGKGKAKRFVPIESAAAARDPRIIALVRKAAR